MKRFKKCMSVICTMTIALTMLGGCGKKADTDNKNSNTFEPSMDTPAMDEKCPAGKRLYYQGKIQETGNELLKLINDMLEKIIEPFRKQCILENKQIELKMDVDSEML